MKKKPKPPEEDIDDKKMPLLDHLLELRSRLIWSFASLGVFFIVGWVFKEPIFEFLSAPLAHTFPDPSQRRIIFTDPTEAFFTYVKIAFFTGAFLGFPFIATQIWKFVAPGLYRHERQAFLPFLIATPLMFLLGAAFLYYLILPLALQFFASFERPAAEGQLPIQLETKMSEYLSLIMTLIFAFGLSFELPVLLSLLARVGIVSSAGLASKRRYAVVGVVVFAGIVTPPDVLSQVSLAVPMYVLYEASIWIAKLIEKKREDAEAEADEELFGHDEPVAAAAAASPGASTAATVALPPPTVPRPPPIDETDFNTR